MAAAARLGWDDYAAFPDDGVRREILDGQVVVNPPPTWNHQRVIAELYWHIRRHLEDRPLGEAIFSPVALVLPCGDIVEPDLLFLTTDNPIPRAAPTIEGVPDLVVEVLSPSNRRRDLIQKRRIYEQAGVLEYWILDPEAESLTRFVLEDSAYVATPAVFATPGGTIETPLLPEFTLDVASIFRVPGT